MKIFLNYIIHPILLICLLFFVAGCSSGGSAGGSSSTTAVSGSVVAGPTNGASITVKTAAGTVVAGPVTSGADGSYSISIPTAALANDLIFEASGGTFDDEAEQTVSGKGVAMKSLSAFVSGGTLAVGSIVTLDPSSTIIQKMIAGGKTKAAAEAAFNTAFGYTPDCSLRPAFTNMSTTSTDKQRLAGLRIASFSQLTKDLINDPAKQFELIDSLNEDISDNTLDGKKTGAAVTTASGFTIPEDIANRFVAALVGFQASGLNKSKLTWDKIGALPFNKVALTTSYKVEYIPGSTAAIQGRTTFNIKVSNLSDGTPAIGKAVTLIPHMYMATKDHTTPTGTVTDNGDGTYTCNVYYVMSSMMGSVSMGVWKLGVNIGTESALFYPNVTMPMGVTTLAKLFGVTDSMMGIAGAEKRTYFLFKDSLASDGIGTYSFGLFLATKESMTNFPAVKVADLLNDQTGTPWTVTAISVQVSTDKTNWVNATDSGSGHWLATGLTGLTAGVSGKIYVKLTVNGEQKTTDGLAPDNTKIPTNEYQTFTVSP